MRPLVRFPGNRSTLRMPLDHSRSGQRSTAVEVSTPARLHIGMLSFGVPEVRAYGGVGFMIDRPGVHLRITRSDRFAARGPLALRALECARACAEAWGLGETAACEIEVMRVPDSHAGLGSGTQLGLAVAAGVRHLFHPSTVGKTSATPSPGKTSAAPSPADGSPCSSDGPWLFENSDALELARAAGRGRRSCIGVYGFSGGGMIVEGGRLLRDDHAGENDTSRTFSPLVARVRLPAEWRCVVIGQSGAIGLHGDPEKQAFALLPPVPMEISAELSRIALMDLLPAAIEGRFVEFSEAVFRYGLLAGKPFERASSRLAHAEATLRLIERLRDMGVHGAAQSSWGPTVMACCASLAAAEQLVERFAEAGLTRHYDTLIAGFDNQGAVLREIRSDQAGTTGSP